MNSESKVLPWIANIQNYLKRFKEAYGIRIKTESETLQRWNEIEKKRKEEEDETIRLIKAIQMEEEMEREKRRQAEEEKNLSNCDICLEKIEAKDLMPLDRCGHLYHPSCIGKYFEVQIESRCLPLVCPLCEIEVTLLDVKEFLNSTSQKKWEEYSFRKVIDSNPDNFSYCPTPDCSYVFVWDQKNDTSEFRCPQCNKHYCLNCRCVYHVGQTCKEYQISANFSVIYSYDN